MFVISRRLMRSLNAAEREIFHQKMSLVNTQLIIQFTTCFHPN